MRSCLLDEAARLRIRLLTWRSVNAACRSALIRPRGYLIRDPADSNRCSGRRVRRPNDPNEHHRTLASRLRQPYPATNLEAPCRRERYRVGSGLDDGPAREAYGNFGNARYRTRVRGGAEQQPCHLDLQTAVAFESRVAATDNPGAPPLAMPAIGVWGEDPRWESNFSSSAFACMGAAVVHANNAAARPIPIDFAISCPPWKRAKPTLVPSLREIPGRRDYARFRTITVAGVRLQRMAGTVDRRRRAPPAAFAVPCRADPPGVPLCRPVACEGAD
jgi:hypothetical protein